MQVVCPHCRNTAVLPEPTPAEVVCGACGSSITLQSGATAVWGPVGGGRTLGKFELIDLVGAGACGSVYKARDTELDRVVAIKVPRSGWLEGGGAVERFLREARCVAQLRHPSIVPVFDVGQSDGVPYLVSAFVPGQTLADLLTARRPTAPEAARLAATVADALQYAHDNGVIHRDVKPSNVLLDAGGAPHLTDFGLARRDSGDATMTVDGQVLGTPAYMSPEQARGEGHTVDGRSDVYSVGVILYELLTGRLPFLGNGRAILNQVLHDDPEPPRKLERSLSRDLETVCLKAMAKEPAGRYASAGELADDLRCYLNGEPVLGRRPGLARRARRWVGRHRTSVALAGGGLVGACVGLLVVLAPSPKAQPQAPPEGRPPAPAVGQDNVVALPADLDLVPRDALAFVTVRPADVLRLDAVRRLQERLVRDIPAVADDVRAWPAAFEKTFGTLPDEIDRITFVVRSPTPNPDSILAVVQTARPYNRVRLQQHYGGVERTFRGHGYYARSDTTDAVHLVTESIYVVAPSAVSLREYLSREAPGNAAGGLRDGLALAAQPHHLVAGFNPPPGLLGQLGLALPEQFAPARPLLGLRSATLTIDVQSPVVPTESGDVLQAELALAFPDESATQQGHAAGRATITAVQTQLREALAGFVRLDQTRGLGRTFTAVFNRYEFVLQSTRVQQYGKTVLFLPPPVPIDLVYGGEVVKEIAASAERTRDSADRAVSLNNLRQIFTALANWADPEGRYPPAALVKDGKPLLSWRVAILPYVEAGDLYKQFHLDEPWDSEHNKKLLAQMPKVYAPVGRATAEPYRTFYQVPTGPGTAFEGPAGVALTDFPDGKKQTFLVVEAGEAVPWTKPEDLAYDPARPLPKLGGLFPDGFHAVFADGAYRFVPRQTDERTLRALFTRNGGEPVDRDKLP